MNRFSNLIAPLSPGSRAETQPHKHSTLSAKTRNSRGPQHDSEHFILTNKLFSG